MYRFQQNMHTIPNSFSTAESFVWPNIVRHRFWSYSALSYLNKFPVSEIKIDQSFVQGIADNNDHRLIVQAIISMAKSLNKELVAEGVETVEQAEYLRDYNCNVVQGFLFSKPKSFDEIEM